MRTQRLILWAALSLLLAGCGSAGSVLKQPDPVKHYYVLQAERDARACSMDPGKVLKIRRLNVAPSFSARELTYRVGAEEYDSDYYNLFLVSPQDMLTQAVYEWLSNSGLFAHVVPGSSAMRPDYVLEANVTRLYGDFSDPANSQAVLEMQFFLLKDVLAQYNVAFCKDYRRETPLEDRSAKALAAALEDSLTDILGELEEDIAATLMDAPTADTQDQP